MSTRQSEATIAAAEGRCPNCGQPRADLSTACEHCGAPALGPADPAPPADEEPRRATPDSPMQVRAADMEPHVGLRYVGKLFRLIALVIVLLLIAEVVTGLTQEGTAAIPTLLGVVSRLLVMAALLWGLGDLALLLIEIGHDLRATRILIGRQAAQHLAEHHQDQRRRDRDGRRDGERRSRERDHVAGSAE